MSKRMIDILTHGQKDSLLFRRAIETATAAELESALRRMMGKPRKMGVRIEINKRLTALTHENVC